MHVHHDESEAADLVKLPNILVPAELVSCFDAEQADNAVVRLKGQKFVITAPAGVNVGEQLLLRNGGAQRDIFVVELKLLHILLFGNSDTDELDAVSVAHICSNVVISLLFVRLSLEDRRGNPIAEHKLDEREAAAVGLPPDLLDHEIAHLEIREVYRKLNKVVLSRPVESELFVQAHPV